MVNKRHGHPPESKSKLKKFNTTLLAHIFFFYHRKKKKSGELVGPFINVQYVDHHINF